MLDDDSAMPSCTPSVVPDTSIAAPSADWIKQAPGCWWVAHTRARNEKVVAAALERRRILYYLPLVRLERTYAKCRVTVWLPLFPGYLFLCGGPDAYETAWKTNRVANILDVDDQEQLRSELVQICQVVETGEQVDLFKSLRKGRRCRITGGILKGLEGVVLRRGRHCRMYLSVTMLGQSAAVEVDGALVEAVE